jgi:hypothetical protein
MIHGKMAVAAAGSLLVFGSAAADALQGLSMELVNTGPSGNTYRLFADLEAGAGVAAVSGGMAGSGYELLIGTANGATFYQNSNGGPTSQDINSNFFPFAPSMEWDSYVSIGALYQDGVPFGGNELTVGPFDWTDFESGGDLEGLIAWGLDGSDQNVPGSQGGELNGQVFLGQFTVSGGNGDVSDLMGQINIQGWDSMGEYWLETGVTWVESTGPAVPGIGALAPLACIGLVRRRRRG